VFIVLKIEPLGFRIIHHPSIFLIIVHALFQKDVSFPVCGFFFYPPPKDFKIAQKTFLLFHVCSMNTNILAFIFLVPQSRYFKITQSIWTTRCVFVNNNSISTKILFLVEICL